ncbi:unnamed protein product [Echinostoma caproni]|uniref:Uncharacterized protein n=1 Tax=Echinostoma caproni TaxID=27848 RepID=A0A183BDE8_9TREM|nr:unnamed protein product [Echinostoma caproni]
MSLGRPNAPRAILGNITGMYNPKGHRDGVGLLKTGGQSVAADDNCKADTLGLYLSSVHRTDNSMPSTPPPATPPVVIDDLRLTEDMVRNHL